MQIGMLFLLKLIFCFTEIIEVEDARVLKTLLGENVWNAQKSIAKQKSNKLKDETINKETGASSAKAKKRKSKDGDNISPKVGQESKHIQISNIISYWFILRITYYAN